MSIFTSNIPLIVNNISTMKDVSAQNMDLSGSLDVSGNTTIGGALQANGGITCDTDKFVVEDATGNTSIGGTLNVETSLTTNQLIVNDDLYFDTIVIRRPTAVSYNDSNFQILLRELQCWVSGSNILINGDIITYFADFTNNGEEIDSYGEGFLASNINNNVIETDGGGVSSTINAVSSIALILKEIPRTKIQDIQSIVLYNWITNISDRVIGLAIELYNIDIDPNLESPLASTDEISSVVKGVYRYDFPAIDTYPSGDFSDTDSITQIASETLALKEVVSEFAGSVNIAGGLNVDTITLKDTDGRSGMIHMNSNNMFFLSGVSNSEVWTQVNGEWPLILHTDTNRAQFGGNIDTVGNITCEGYMKADDKPRMRIERNGFTLPSGTTSLLNGGSVTLQSNCTVSSGIFIATISGIYACSCKLRLPDNNTQSPEIQWYRRASNGTQTKYEYFEMWIPQGVSGRRSGMSHTLIDLSVGQGILPRNDLNTMGNCVATFDVFMIQ